MYMCIHGRIIHSIQGLFINRGKKKTTYTEKPHLTTAVRNQESIFPTEKIHTFEHKLRFKNQHCSSNCTDLGVSTFSWAAGVGARFAIVSHTRCQETFPHLLHTTHRDLELLRNVLAQLALLTHGYYSLA